MVDKRILIIGAGPTGLGAAWRLNELGYSNWLLVERESVAGGLAASIRDEHGFTWDLGGHVQFSHYDYFDRLMDLLLGRDGWLEHERESWIRIFDRFVPYPFQMNIRRLPREQMKEALLGLVRLQKVTANAKPANFGEWIDASMGEGIARMFMRPYNFKVWAHQPEELDYSWIGERVARVDLERVIANIIDERDDVSWGPNNTFRFPRFGGTGAVWRACADRLPKESVRYDVAVCRVDTVAGTVHLSDGSTESYDLLLSTMPLDRLVGMSDMQDLQPRAEKLVYSSTHVFGIGLRGAPSPEIEKKCWMYFPEANCPFYRVTVFSNYSPNNVPDITRFWSLMAEISESPHKPVPPPDELMEEVTNGLVNAGLISTRDEIVDRWQMRLEYGYPTPWLGRDRVLLPLLQEVENRGVFSRGRFGAWRYEVSNQDHSLMQGVEWVDRVLEGKPETTLFHPEIVNAPRQRL